MPQIKKYDDEFRMNAFNLYCEGKSPKQIAGILNVSNLVIKRLKNKKFPMDWDQGRAERVLKKVDFVQNNALRSIEEMLARHQQILSEIYEKMAKLLCKKANQGKINDRVAMNCFFKAIREEQKLYLPLLLIHSPKFFQESLIQALQDSLGEERFLQILRHAVHSNQ